MLTQRTISVFLLYKQVILSVNRWINFQININIIEIFIKFITLSGDMWAKFFKTRFLYNKEILQLNGQVRSAGGGCGRGGLTVRINRWGFIKIIKMRSPCALSQTTRSPRSSRVDPATSFTELHLVINFISFSRIQPTLHLILHSNF